jgi:hypothetical protein
VDANHAEIVRALLGIGCSVLDLSRVGQGAPDLLVALAGRNLLLEVKDGAKAPSERRLTVAQVEFRAKWRGQWACVTSVDEAIEVVTRHAQQEPQADH